MSSREDDALDLVAWLEKQPGQATTKTNAEIAVSLGWWGEKTHQPEGDPRRVSRAAKYIDHDTELFSQHSVGTRTRGSGKHRMKLVDLASDAHAMDVRQEAQTLLAAHRSWAAEGGRILGRWTGLRDQEERAGNVANVRALTGAVRDLEATGKLSYRTELELVELGLLSL